MEVAESWSSGGNRFSRLHEEAPETGYCNRLPLEECPVTSCRYGGLSVKRQPISRLRDEAPRTGNWQPGYLLENDDDNATILGPPFGRSIGLDRQSVTVGDRRHAAEGQLVLAREVAANGFRPLLA